MGYKLTGQMGQIRGLGFAKNRDAPQIRNGDNENDESFSLVSLVNLGSAATCDC
jgi:hypothetical protein